MKNIIGFNDFLKYYNIYKKKGKKFEYFGSGVSILLSHNIYEKIKSHIPDLYKIEEFMHKFNNLVDGDRTGKRKHRRMYLEMVEKYDDYEIIKIKNEDYKNKKYIDLN